MMRAYRLVRVPKSTADRSWERPSCADHFALGSESARICWIRYGHVSNRAVRIHALDNDNDIVLSEVEPSGLLYQRSDTVREEHGARPSGCKTESRHEEYRTNGGRSQYRKFGAGPHLKAIAGKPTTITSPR